MARKVMLVDDLDGTPAKHSVSITYKGSEYTLDLSQENADRLDDALEPFLSKAAKTGKKRVRSSASDKAKNDSIRDWARENGHDIPMRGRIPESIRAAYENRNEGANTSHAEPYQGSH
ncbi:MULTISPECIES: Lsr2 family protein [Paenarthrobacter]|uniref:Lsr2 family protein n=1 Tax=Paenarthrobacter ureafaciens TaxID=37931 RepID=A0AAX3EQ80_PAEUR|nr:MULTISPECIES: Lsr2 family protein [Paenarthrobacter]MDO5867095.1 Lsr2 family protein [Paenarthrobacter sp. SD-2]MDO5878264.1 Lsr2 family protein [Paenarthrobacter sp. SD-1]UYV95536.1 Lsr2 family protein [Paenarthrobacter ureafaciens]UYW00137.1 Lsr2 family protein [Paenarthrobacter ureafaciens]